MQLVKRKTRGKLEKNFKIYKKEKYTSTVIKK